jgi:hypothetical protein
LRHTAHLARQPRARISVVNLLGDAVALRSDIASHLAMAVECRRLVDVAAADLAAAEAALAHGGDEVLDDINRELARARAAIDAAAPHERPGLQQHVAHLEAGRAERLTRTIGAGLEAGVFVTWGREATVIEVGFAEVGDWQVVIAEQLNAAARGTSRSASLVTARDARREKDEARVGRRLIDPFAVHTSADPEDLAPSTTFHNAGAALMGDALTALQAATRDTLTVQPFSVPRTSVPPSLARYWWPRAQESFIVARDATAAPTHLLRFTGRVTFRGLEASGPVDVWELLLVDRGFGRDFIEGLRHAGR